MLAAAGVTPYLLATLPRNGPKPLPSVPVIVAALMAQTGVLSFLFAWGGTAAGRKIGAERSLLEARLAGDRPRLSGTLGIAAVLGAVAGLAIAGLDVFFARWMPAPIRGELPRPTPLEGALACFYGGITEEVLMRLGLMTLLAWAVSRLFGAEGPRRTFALWVGIVGATLLFGAGHLPAAAQIWPLGPAVIVRTLALNGVVGVAAGVIYARKGIEHAMALHFSADVVLHVLLPAILMR